MVVKVGCPASSVLCLRRTHVLASYLSSFVDSVDMVFNRVCKFFIISVCACVVVLSLDASVYVCVIFSVCNSAVNPVCSTSVYYAVHFALMTFNIAVIILLLPPLPFSTEMHKIGRESCRERV